MGLSLLFVITFKLMYYYKAKSVSYAGKKEIVRNQNSESKNYSKQGFEHVRGAGASYSTNWHVGI